MAIELLVRGETVVPNYTDASLEWSILIILKCYPLY